MNWKFKGWFLMSEEMAIKIHQELVDSLNNMLDEELIRLYLLENSL